MNKTIRDTFGSKIHPFSNGINGLADAFGKENQGYAYYRGKFPYSERNAYEIVKKGMLECNDRIIIESVSVKRCEDIFNAVLLDTPMLFHINGSSVVKSGGKTCLMPKYTMPNGEYLRYKQECDKALQQLCAKMGESEWDKLWFLHEEFITHIKYQDGKQGVHDIIGPLLRQEGVCDGIAKSVKAACDLIGIPCVVVRGEACQDSGVIGSHAWNTIKIGDEWRFFDFTFDITLNQSNPCMSLTRMDYFSLSYEAMSVDHFKWSACTRSSNKGKDCFERNNIVVRKQEDLNHIICHSSIKPIECAYKVDKSWKNYNNTLAVEVAVNKLIERIGSGCRYSVAFNNSQRVGYIRIE